MLYLSSINIVVVVLLVLLYICPAIISAC